MKKRGVFMVGSFLFEYLCTTYSFWPWKRRWYVQLVWCPWPDVELLCKDLPAWNPAGVLDRIAPMARRLEDVAMKYGKQLKLRSGEA